MTKVVVTGGAGFIGSHLVDTLVELGYEVHVPDAMHSGIRCEANPKAKYYVCDIAKAEGLPFIFRGAETVYHLAALARVQKTIESPLESFEANVRGTAAVLEVARMEEVKRVVNISSSSVYGDSQKLPLFEDDPLEPMSPYAAHKLMGETLCKMYSITYGMETVSLRPFNVYGPGLDPNGPYALVIGIFLRQWLAGEPLTITGDGTQTRDFTYVDDIVRGILLAGASQFIGRGEAINLGTGKETSINTLAKMFSDNVQYIAARSEPKRTRADNQRALYALGWQPKVALEEGIKELKWLAQA